MTRKASPLKEFKALRVLPWAKVRWSDGSRAYYSEGPTLVTGNTVTVCPQTPVEDVIPMARVQSLQVNTR